MHNPTEQFRDAIQSAGLIPPEVIEADGKLHRFASNGKRGDDAGWYALHGDGIPAGSFGDWRSGQQETWRADIGRSLTPAEDAAHRAKVEAMNRERKAEEKRKHAEAAIKATAVCVFHANWTVIPRQAGHAFHMKLDSRSAATRG